MKKAIVFGVICSIFLSVMCFIPAGANEQNQVLDYYQNIDVPVYYDLNQDGEMDMLQMDHFFNYYGCYAVVINGHSYITNIVRHGHYDFFFVTDIDETDGFLDLVLVGTYKGAWLEAFRYDGTQLYQNTEALTLAQSWDDTLGEKLASMQVTAGKGVLSVALGGETLTFNNFSKYEPVVFPDESVQEAFSEGGTGNYFVTLNGEKLTFDQNPVNKKDRIMIPIRTLFEKMGYVLEWDGETRTVHAVKENSVISIQVGNKSIFYIKDGVRGTYECDVMPLLVAGRTLIPLRGVAEAAGCLVEWNESENTAVITSR